jgi:UDP-2-acetamido-3-amino-2,3-dideoxy-glucuronate N-acetyltransferase
MNRNLAVVGVGDWGKNLVRNFQAIEALLAVCDVDENRLKPCQERCPEVMIYSDFDKLLRNPEVKALAISTPATTHYALAKRALLEDRDVFIEKPISIRCREAEELLSLADERKRILMVGHILLYHPAISKLKGLMVSGELGKVRYIYSNRLNLGKIRTEENILWSFAPHDISAILYLLDEMPDSISANGGSYINRSVADVTVSNLSFPSGVRAHVFVSWLHPFKEQRLVVVGEKKMVLFNDVEPLKKLVVYEHTIEMAANVPVPKPQIGRHIETEPKEPLLLECRHFVECVQERTRPLTDGEEGLRVLKVLEASQASLEKNGRVIKLGTNKENKYFVHGSVEIDDSVSIGEGTKIWHFSHVMRV